MSNKTNITKPPADNVDASSMIDLTKYPISDLSAQHSRAFADQCRDQYVQTGLCMLPGFIVPAALDALATEASGFSEKAYFCKSSHNAYLNDGDSSADNNDASNRQEQTFVGSVAYDYITAESRLRQLYQWDPLKDFIGYVLRKSPFYRFADPFGACSINVFVEGGEHGPKQGARSNMCPGFAGWQMKKTLLAECSMVIDRV